MLDTIAFLLHHTGSNGGVCGERTWLRGCAGVGVASMARGPFAALPAALRSVSFATFRPWYSLSSAVCLASCSCSARRVPTPLLTPLPTPLVVPLVVPLLACERIVRSRTDGIRPRR
eukprot:6827041-Pyramimonas_sp.AAC.1